MTEIINVLLRWWPLPFFLIQMVMAWGMWSLGQKFVSRCDYERDMDKHIARVTELEQGAYKSPTRDEVKDLSDKLGGLGEKLSRIDGRLTGINRAVDLLNQHHLRTSE